MPKQGKQKRQASGGNCVPKQALCKLQYTEGSDFSGCPCEEQDQGLYSLCLTPASLEQVLEWFVEKATASASSGACLSFVSCTGKGERALIHSVVEARFPSLETVSQGLGEDRLVAVYCRGQAPKPTANEQYKLQGAWLYKFAREAGLGNHSQDELVERLATGALTDELKQVWEQRSAEQEAVEELLQAVAADDASKVQELCALNPGVANAAHIDSSELPLLAAARLNCAAAARALLKHGTVNLEAKCPSTGRTALKTARMFESTEVEAVLLQMGAHDPEASSFPIAHKDLISLDLQPQLRPSPASLASSSDPARETGHASTSMPAPAQPTAEAIQQDPPAASPAKDSTNAKCSSKPPSAGFLESWPFSHSSTALLCCAAAAGVVVLASLRHSSDVSRMG